MTQFTFENGDTVVLGSGELAADDFNDAPHVLTDDRVWLQGHKLPPRVKPTYPVEIDWDHPLSKGLVFKADLTNGGYDEVGRRFPDFISTTLTVSGNQMDFSSGGYLRYDDITGSLLDQACGNDVSRIIVLIGVETTTTNNRVVLEKGTNKHFIVQTSGSTPYGMDIRTGGDSGASIALSDDGLPPHTIAYAINENDESEAWLNGARIGTKSGALTQASADNNPLVIGARNGGSYPYQGKLSEVWIFASGWSSGRLAELSRDPYQFLKPAGVDQQIITPAATADDKVWLI